MELVEAVLNFRSRFFDPDEDPDRCMASKGILHMSTGRPSNLLRMEIGSLLISIDLPPPDPDPRVGVVLEAPFEAGLVRCGVDFFTGKMREMAALFLADSSTVEFSRVSGFGQFGVDFVEDFRLVGDLRYEP